MVKCPKCGKEGKIEKQWLYGPKSRKGPSFEVTLFQCPSGHYWRDYKKTKTNVVTGRYSVELSIESNRFFAVF